MACKISFVFLATFAVACCNPLGQTICESQTTPSLLPNAFPFLPLNFPGRNIFNPRTTVCESTPNIGMNLGLNSHILPFNPLLGMLSQMPANAPSTTVCESSTVPTPMQSLMGALPSTTVCESSAMPYPNVFPVNNLPSTTVCESTQTPFNNIPILPNSKSTTVCESSQSVPNLGLGLSYPMGGLGVPMMGMGLPYPLTGLGLPMPIMTALLNYLGMV